MAQGWKGGGGELEGHTTLLNPNGCDGIPATQDDNLVLRAKAPGHNEGVNGLIPLDRGDVDDNSNTNEQLPLDFYGYGWQRIDQYVGIVDMGAYEIVCQGDVDGSGEVDIDDIFQILANWGPCQHDSPDEYPADVDFSCSVDIDDLFAALGNWGECDGTGASTPPQNVMDCILQYGSDPEDLATCLQAIQLTGGGQ